MPVRSRSIVRPRQGKLAEHKVVMSKPLTSCPSAPPLAIRLHSPHLVKCRWNNKLPTGDLHPNRQLKQQLILMQNMETLAHRTCTDPRRRGGVRGLRPTAWLIPGYWANRRQWGNSEPRVELPLRRLFCNFYQTLVDDGQPAGTRRTLIDAFACSREHVSACPKAVYLFQY